MGENKAAEAAVEVANYVIDQWEAKCAHQQNRIAELEAALTERDRKHMLYKKRLVAFFQQKMDDCDKLIRGSDPQWASLAKTANTFWVTAYMEVARAEEESE